MVILNCQTHERRRQLGKVGHSRLVCFQSASKGKSLLQPETAFQENTNHPPQPSPPTHGSQSVDDSHKKVKGGKKNKNKKNNQVLLPLGDGLRADPRGHCLPAYNCFGLFVSIFFTSPKNVLSPLWQHWQLFWNLVSLFLLVHSRDATPSFW